MGSRPQELTPCDDTLGSSFSLSVSKIFFFFIGKLVPAGTGMACYRDVELKEEHPEPVTEEVSAQ